MRIILCVLFVVSSALARTEIDPICFQTPGVVGECWEYFERWSYVQETSQCAKFFYGGCGGNDNRFASQEGCERTCFGFD
ncbi:hypothetical protein ACLKA6_019388 [Drosophila palustris]